MSRYDPYTASFGATVSATGPLADVFTHRFSTKPFDTETGLVVYQLRPYSPTLGRWINRDPIEEKGGNNLFGFVGNNPVSRWDLLGHAYFALRPLEYRIMVPIPFFSHNIISDLFNVEVAHEQIFFEDGEKPSNIGFFNDNTVNPVHEDNPQLFKYYNYRSRKYNDCVLREAVSTAASRSYSLLGDKVNSKFNCQEWTSEVRRIYRRSFYDQRVKMKCCLY